MTKSIVTGAAGFIGSNLAQKLLDEGHEVTGIDSFEDHYPRWIKEKNVSRLKRHPSFRLIEDSLMDLDLKNTLRNFDYVFHQSAQPGVRGSFGQFFRTYVTNNIMTTQKLLEAAKGNNLKRFIFASSSSVYGNTPDLPAKEDSLLFPYSPYGVTKLAAEHLVRVYNDNFGIPAVVLRYFTVYGPGQRPDMAFHRFIKAILGNKTITVYGDGKQTRDFTFVSDIVRANLLAINAPEGRVFNVGGGSRISLADAVDAIGGIMKSKPVIDFQPAQRGDVKDTWADLKAAEDILGYRPEIGLEQGLVQEIEYIRELYADSAPSQS